MAGIVAYVGRTSVLIRIEQAHFWREEWACQHDRRAVVKRLLDLISVPRLFCLAALVIELEKEFVE